MKSCIVSVVLLNWEKPIMTMECVDSILNSTGVRLDIHIVDNGSKDDSEKLLRQKYSLEKRVTLHRITSNCGYARGMNFGLQKAVYRNPDYLMVINNDTIVSRTAINGLVRSEQRHSPSVVTGKVFDFSRKKILQTVGYRFDRKTLESRKIGFEEEDIGQYDFEEKRDMIDDIFMLIPTAIYRETGGYNPVFYLNYEQTDWIMRIIEKGYEVWYTPKAGIWHKGSYTTGGIGNPYMMFWEGKSKIILHSIHQGRMPFSCFYAGYLSGSVWSVIKGVAARCLGRKTNLNSRLARLCGVLAGTFWLIFRNEETGRNPFLNVRAN